MSRLGPFAQARDRLTHATGALREALLSDLARDRGLARAVVVRLALAHFSFWLALIWAHLAIAVAIFEIPARLARGELIGLALTGAGGWGVLALWLLRGALARARGLVQLSAFRQASRQVLAEARTKLASPGLAPGVWLAIGLVLARLLVRTATRPRARGWLMLGLLLRLVLRVAASRMGKTQAASRAPP